MLSSITPQKAALFILMASIAVIAGAWAFEWAGYAPCPLCLQQRWPWYGAILVSALVAVAAQGSERAAGLGLGVLALLFVGSAVFGAYHAGVEWKWWPGPTTCAGEIGGGSVLPDLTNDPVIGCEEAALRILGLSLAGWNALISAGLALVAISGALRR